MLPLGVKSDRLNKWIVKNLNKYLRREDYELCILSSRTGQNFRKILHLFKHLEKLTKSKHKPKVFITGTTNVGKSTFLNKLINKSNYYSGIDKKKNPKVDKLEVIKKFAEDPALTASSLPGTTQGFIKIKKAHVGFGLHDTPGVPNKYQLYTHLDDYQEMMSTIITKRIKPYNIQVKAGTSIWLGGLARIDVLKRTGVCLSIFVGENVTIHKTTVENADRVYQKHVGDLLRPAYSVDKDKIEWETHSIGIQGPGKDLAIQGLGWIGIGSGGVTEILLRIPKEVNFVIRDSLMPFELKDKKLNKHPIIGINVKTRRNTILRKNFKAKLEVFKEAKGELDEVKQVSKDARKVLKDNKEV